MRLHWIRHARITVTLGLLASVVVLALPGAASAATQGCADDASGVTDLTATWEADLLAATNAHRTGMGLTALQLDATLTKASVWKARDMARRNYFAHDDEDNGDAPARSPWDRLAACGWTSGGSRAENIAAGYGSAAQTVAAWIASPGHRANIENGSLRYVGFGVASSVSSTYGEYQVQMFSSVAGPLAAAPPVAQPPAAPTVRTLTVIVGAPARIVCPPSGVTFVVASSSGALDVATSADGCITVTPREGSGGTAGTVTYRSRATAGGLTSAPVELAVTIDDLDRTPQGTDPGDVTGGGPLASTFAATTARVARTRCRGAWSVDGWCYRIVVRGRVLVDDHTASAGRSVVVSRMTASRRLAFVARATTNAGGVFTTSTRIRPSSRATATWLARNASRLRVGAASSSDAAPTVSWVATRRSL